MKVIRLRSANAEWRDFLEELRPRKGGAANASDTLNAVLRGQSANPTYCKHCTDCNLKRRKKFELEYIPDTHTEHEMLPRLGMCAPLISVATGPSYLAGTHSTVEKIPHQPPNQNPGNLLTVNQLRLLVKHDLPRHPVAV